MGCPTVRRNKSLLHHENAPCYTSLAVRHFLVKNGIPPVTQSLYSPALAVCVTSGLLWDSKTGLKGPLFCFIRRNSTASNSRSHSNHKTELPDMLQAMAVLQENVCAVGLYFEANWVRFNTYHVFYKLCKVHGSHWPSHVLFWTPLVTFSNSETSNHSTKWKNVLLHNTNFSCLMFLCFICLCNKWLHSPSFTKYVKTFYHSLFEVCINALK